ncbi:MAPK-activated protein kinase Srk1 [Sporothrix eucalyptigena]|uniref:MAPK-activated protein kinase Srk1 n=1 Tax=Sporothrix eucalyptigena TaxID=1812306 RepID=A0ABP0BEG9_9PEZI
MSTIQQLKNFIRHGKQARVVDEQVTRKEVSSRNSPPQQLSPTLATTTQQRTKQHAISDPGRTTRTVAASDPAAAYAQQDPDGLTQPLTKTTTKSRRVDDQEIAKIVAEERETRSKFPRYPGLERWELLEKMGDGAFSNVYRARDKTGAYPNDVAIKVVRKYEMNSTQRANILKEVTIMRKLDHPNIVRLLEFSEAKQYYYIVLELAPGGELFHQIVKLTYFSEDLSRHVIIQVAKALEYLHEEQGVVHRDIKPENILFYPIPFVESKNPKPRQAGDEDKVDEGEFIPGKGAGGIGQIKIADFGLSKVIWETNTTTPCGTVGYTAPEIVKDEMYSKSVDMWALGCVLYTLLCGFPPFYDESIEVLTEKVAKGQFTFLSPWWDDISKSAQDLISHLLDVNPERRYTITEFMNHPWIRASGPTPRDEKKLGADGTVLKPFDMAKIVDGDRRGDFRSPGAVNLREVFDVGYAVHRQEEEDKRRKNLGTRTPGVARMMELTEADEESTSSSTSATNTTSATNSSNDQNYAHYSSKMAAAHSNNGNDKGTQDLEHGMRNTTIRGDAPQEQRRGRERERAQPAASTNERGYGQHSATVAAAARQQVRDHNRAKGAFELNLEGATLLGRRGAKPAARVA